MLPSGPVSADGDVDAADGDGRSRHRSAGRRRVVDDVAGRLDRRDLRRRVAPTVRTVEAEAASNDVLKRRSTHT